MWVPPLLGIFPATKSLTTKVVITVCSYEELY